jgi:hypothetical protein
MAKFVADLERTSEAKSYTISTGAGPIIPRLREDGQVRADFYSLTNLLRDFLLLSLMTAPVR